MNRLKLFRFFLFLSCISFYGFSVSAQNAHEIMDRAVEAFRKADGIQAEFTMQLEADSQVLKGTICLQGEKFVLDAGGVKTWFNGHTQWSYIKANEEVNMSVPTADELYMLNPYAWLSLYKKGYQIQLLQSTGKVFNISMVSEGAQQVYHRIGIELDKRSYFPLSIRMQHGKNEQDSVQIRILSFRSQQHYADSFFLFYPEKYPNVEVIDLR